MTLMSANVYANKLDDIVYKQNNAYDRTIKKKPIDVESHIMTQNLKVMINNLNLQLVTT